MTCFLEEKTHTPNISQRLKLNWHEAKNKKKQRHRNKTSHITLFLLKDEAALFPFAREAMQYCTTEYHPRPKCGRNIHRYINIKICPIQTFLPISIPRFFSRFFAPTRPHVFHVVCCKDVIFVLVYASVCGALCECLLSKPRAPQSQNHMLVKSNWGEILKGREGKRGGRGTT